MVSSSGPGCDLDVVGAVVRAVRVVGVADLGAAAHGVAAGGGQVAGVVVVERLEFEAEAHRFECGGGFEDGVGLAETHVVHPVGSGGQAGGVWSGQ